MKKGTRALFDLTLYLVAVSIVSVSWVSMHMRNHAGDSITQAISHSKLWLVGIGILLAVATAMFRPSSDK
jgi:hypothetical protein